MTLKKGELAIHPRALKVFEDESRFKVLYGGRDSGKSTQILNHFVLLSFNTGSRFLCIKKTARTIKQSIYSNVVDAIEQAGLEAYFTFTEAEITNKTTGAVFLFTGLLPTAKRIKSINNIQYAFIEEAAELSQDDWDIVIPTIREPGNQIFIAFNPEDGNEPVYQMFVQSSPSNATVLKLNYTDNPFLSAESAEQIELTKQHDYERYLHIYEGHPLRISDQVIFKDRYTITNFEAEEPTTFYYGADFGVKDPTVLVRCFIKANCLYIDYESYHSGSDASLQMIPLHWEAEVPGSRDHLITCDTNFPQTTMFLKSQNWRVKPVKKTRVIDGINFLKSFDHIYIHPRCKNTAYEFATYSWKTDRLSGQLQPEPEDADNHAIDAIRYSLADVYHNRGRLTISQQNIRDFKAMLG